MSHHEYGLCCISPSGTQLQPGAYGTENASSRPRYSSRNSIKPGVGYNTTARLAIIAVWRFLPCISEGSIEISWKQQQLLSICRTVRYSRFTSTCIPNGVLQGCVRYGYRGYRTEVTEVSGIGIDVVTNLPKCPVPVLMS